MAVLGNGITTLDFGSLTWVAAMNSNFALLYSITGMDNLLSGKSLATHDHDEVYEVDSTTIDQAWLTVPLEVLSTDIQFTNDTEGIVVVDTATSDDVRIYVDDGVISSEVVT